jgi:hypothetical protein
MSSIAQVLTTPEQRAAASPRAANGRAVLSYLRRNP